MPENNLLDFINDRANGLAHSYEEYCDIWDYYIEDMTPQIFILLKGEEYSHAEI